MVSEYYEKNLFVKYKVFEHQKYLIVGYKTYEINDLAYYIWKQLDFCNNVKDIIDDCYVKFTSLNYECLAQDINEYLEFLENAQMIFPKKPQVIYMKPMIKEVSLIPATVIS